MIPRSQLIEKSLSCFDTGAFSFIPIIGFFIAPLSLVHFRFVVVNTNDRWNPARPHLYLGAAFALLSLLLHATVAVIIYVQVIRNYLNA
jgi:hypothetical protein